MANEIFSDNSRLENNLKAFGEAVKTALENFASEEFARTNGPIRFSEDSETKRVFADNTKTAERAFDAIETAFNTLREIAKERGIDIPDIEI